MIATHDICVVDFFCYFLLVNMKKNIFWLLLLLSACSDSPEKEDPHQEFNKDMLNFNLVLDENIVHPVSDVYKEGTSDTARYAIGSFLNNLKEPYYMLNYLIAGNPEKAANALFRFVTNSVFGACGFADIGSYVGLDRSETSYKETLTELGIDTGDYLVLPIFGPSSTRDAIGEVASWFCDPVGYVIGFPWMLGKAALTVVNDRAENSETLDKALKETMDIYSVSKSMYFQKYGVKSGTTDSGQQEAFDDSPAPDDEEEN